MVHSSWLLFVASIALLINYSHAWVPSATTFTTMPNRKGKKDIATSLTARKMVKGRSFLGLRREEEENTSSTGLKMEEVDDDETASGTTETVGSMMMAVSSSDDSSDSSSSSSSSSSTSKPSSSSSFKIETSKKKLKGESTAPAGALMPDGGVSPCVIRVLGIGGGGCNAVDRMLDSPVEGVEYWSINTDAQALARSKAMGAKTLNIGTAVTRGLGAGGSPEVGRLAAEESISDIQGMIAGADLCFITAGMGGGTGSGAAPVVAEISKDSGALTIAIVTKPFAFEGRRRMQQANDAIEKLRQHVDTVLVVSNNKLLEIIPDDTPVTAAFRVADEILRQGVAGISEIIVRPGLINVDFADVRAIMKDSGTALMGMGTGTGKTSAEDAAAAAISSPLLDEPVREATGVVFNIIGPADLSLQEVNRAARVIYDNIDENANVIFGALIDENLTDQVSVTVLATGFPHKHVHHHESRGGSGGGGPSGGRSSSRVPDFLR